MSINNVVLSGLLGDAPQIRTLNSGKRVAIMRLATEKSWRKADDTFGKKTAWHTVETFNEFIIEKLETYNKGDQVTVVGELDYDIYDGQKGDKQVRAKILIGERGSRVENHTKTNSRKSDNQDSAPQNNVGDDEIPF